MTLYGPAEQVPWKPGVGAFYANLNQPVAVVLHRMQGWKGTARQWALTGYDKASWHYTVGLDGSVMQHLEHKHGGYHAGIVDTAPKPTWPLWKGRGINVNHYTIGVECEGFAGGDWPPVQLEALLALCVWLAADLGIPFDRAHFPPHADIDVVNRANDFDTPERRESIVYPYLFAQEEEMGMTDDEKLALFAGSEQLSARPTKEERVAYANARIAEIAEGRAPSLQEIGAGGHAHPPIAVGIPDHAHDIPRHRTNGVV